MNPNASKPKSKSLVRDFALIFVAMIIFVWLLSFIEPLNLLLLTVCVIQILDIYQTAWPRKKFKINGDQK